MLYVFNKIYKYNSFKLKKFDKLLFAFKLLIYFNYLICLLLPI